MKLHGMMHKSIVILTVYWHAQNGEVGQVHHHHLQSVVEL